MTRTVIHYFTLSAVASVCLGGDLAAQSAVASSADGLYYAPPVSAAAELERDLANALAERKAREALALAGRAAEGAVPPPGLAPGNDSAYQAGVASRAPAAVPSSFAGESAAPAYDAASGGGPVSAAYGQSSSGSPAPYGGPVPAMPGQPVPGSPAPYGGPVPAMPGQPVPGSPAAYGVPPAGTSALPAMVAGDSAGGGVPYPPAGVGSGGELHGLPWKTSSVTTSRTGDYAASMNGAGYLPPSGVYENVPRERAEHFYRPPQYYRPPVVKFNPSVGAVASVPPMQPDYESYATQIAEPADLDVATVEPGGFEPAVTEQ